MMAVICFGMMNILLMGAFNLPSISPHENRTLQGTPHDGRLVLLRGERVIADPPKKLETKIQIIGDMLK